MKILAVFIISAALCLNATANDQVVSTCLVGSKNIQLIKSNNIYDTHQYTVNAEGSPSVPVFEDVEHSRGASVQSRCIGSKYRFLIFSGEFTANSIEGMIYFYNHKSNKIESFQFAEKNRPKIAYVGPSDFRLVFENGKYGESDSKYTIYDYREGQGPLISYSNAIPKTEFQGWSVSRVRRE